MADYTKYTKQEMQAYAIAKNIKENQIVIVGTGLPLIGASLAKRVVCPSCHPIVESGLMDCSPVEVPRSVGDNRFLAHCAVQWPNVRFVGFEANEWLHDADRMIAFIGGAQIDPYGNVNSTCIFGKGDYVQPTTRFTGSGGANGIATFCNTIIMMQHQKRRFMEHVPSSMRALIRCIAESCPRSFNFSSVVIPAARAFSMDSWMSASTALISFAFSSFTFTSSLPTVGISWKYFGMEK